MGFDSVIVIWQNSELTDGERRRLYTASSRALHQLMLAVPDEMRQQLTPYLAEPQENRP